MTLKAFFLSLIAIPTAMIALFVSITMYQDYQNLETARTYGYKTYSAYREAEIASEKIRNEQDLQRHYNMQRDAENAASLEAIRRELNYQRSR